MDSIEKYKVRNDFINHLRSCLAISGFASYESFKFVKDHQIAELRLISKEVKFLDRIIITIRTEVIEETDNNPYLIVFISAVLNVSFSTSMKNTVLIVCLPSNSPGFIRLSQTNQDHYWKYPATENVGKLALTITSNLVKALDKCLEAIVLGRSGEALFCNSCSLQLFCISSNQFKD